MTKAKRFLISAAIAGTTALVPMSANAFFGMMSYMMGGGWWGPGWGWWGPGWYYPYYGWGYPYYGWGYPYYGWGYPYAWGYPYYTYPVVTAPTTVTQPTSTEK